MFSASGPLRSPPAQIAPTPKDLELMRVVAILQYLVGGLTLLIAAALLPDLDNSDNRAYVALGAIAVLLAVIRYLQRGTMTLTHARFSNFAGLAFITVIVAVSRPIGATPAFYLWPVLTAAYFLRRRDLVVVFVLFMVAFAAALWGFTENESEAQVYVPLVLVVVVVTALVRVMRESLAAMIGDLELTASTDDLTGLANRASFRRSCQRDIDRARRIGAPFSLVVIDLDHFKQVNDTLGHAGGDAALQRFAALVEAECRGGDLPARYGGEEFVVALQDTGLAEATQFAERLRRRLESATLTDAAPLTASMGVAELHVAHDHPGDLIGAADAALYAAKSAGRNRVFRAHQDGDTPSPTPPPTPSPTPPPTPTAEMGDAAARPPVRPGSESTPS